MFVIPTRVAYRLEPHPFSSEQREEYSLPELRAELVVPLVRDRLDLPEAPAHPQARR